MTDRRTLMLLAAAGSAGLLAAAFAFQYLGGLAPCKLCIWQRWPHGLAVLAGLAVLMMARPPRMLALAGAAAAAATAGIALYHTGIERGWWAGPESCSGAGPGLGGLSGADLLSTDAAPAIIMCDQVAWQMLGLSMASWNGLASAGLLLVWLAAWRRPA